MNLLKLEKKLIAAAKASVPSDHVPYAFEKRIMAHLTAPLPVDQWALWGKALWRAAAPCVAVVVLLAICQFMLPRHLESHSLGLSQDLENTVYSAADHLNEQ